VLAPLGRFTYRRRWLVLLVWLLVLTAGGVFGSSVFDRLNAADTRPDVESAVAAHRLDNLGGTGPDLAVLIDGTPATDPGLRAQVTRFATDARAIPNITQVVDAASTPVPGLVSTDGKAQIVLAYLQPGLSQHEIDNTITKVKARADKITAPRVLVGGKTAALNEFNTSADDQLVHGEAIALPIVLILLVIIFRSLLAATMPLITAIVAIAGTLLVLLGVSAATKLSAYAANVVTMVGLGLAVDYALLMVSRFREERARGLDVEPAIERTLQTAGRTVVFSGLTVTAALAGLLIFAEPLLYSMAWGAVGVVVLTAAAALTLLPALLAAWGRRIKPTRAVTRDTGAFYSIARGVQRVAWVLAPLLIIGLASLAAPARHFELAGSGPDTLPETSPSRQVYQVLHDRFPGGGTDPVVAIADVDSASPQAATLARRIQTLPGVVSVTQRPGMPAGMTVLDVTPQGRSDGDIATTLVHQIRTLDPSLGIQVAGTAATSADFRTSIAHRLPYALALIGLVTFVLLFLMTGSLFIPIKAIVMNILSLSATFGVLVWVFQEGHLSRPLDFTPVGELDSAIPLIIFVFAFGLSMDYEVFLLSRIKESYDTLHDNSLAVAIGLQRTGRIVTSAALLMIAVFLGFGAGEVLTIKAIGLGMAVAIAVDATIIRTILVPAVMTLMGRWNWWAPKPLRRVSRPTVLIDRPSPTPISTPTPSETAAQKS
jgi:putative drug exporter of the RND superfamily